MPRDATLNARVDKRAKLQAQKVLARVGLSTSDAVNLLLHHIVLADGIPFDVRIPNKATRRAMAELDAGKGERFKGSAAELRRHILRPRRRA